MRDIRQIIADNGNDNRPAMDTHNLTGRIPRCGFCGDQKPLIESCGMCNLCHKFLCSYTSEGIASND